MAGLGRFRPSPAMLVASIALLVALGGTSWAAVTLAPRSVSNAALKTGAVNSRVIADRSVQNVDLAAGVIKKGPSGPVGPSGQTGAAGPSGPAGPSDAYSRFLNGPIVVPTTSTTLSSLSIPAAGKYVAWAKAYFTPGGPTAFGNVTCTLTAGADSDESQTLVLSPYVWTLANNVVHEFTAAGSVDFKCAFPGTGTANANFIKITAIKVGSLTNSG
jgi:hypothetical protein